MIGSQFTKKSKYIPQKFLLSALSGIMVLKRNNRHTNLCQPSTLYVSHHLLNSFDALKLRNGPQMSQSSLDVNDTPICS